MKIKRLNIFNLKRLSFTILTFLWLLFIFPAVSYANVDQIRFGTTDTALHGLTVTWQSTATSSTIRWGYNSQYEPGFFSGVRRDNYSGYLYNYTFPAVNPSSTLHYSLNDGSGWTADKTFATAVDPSLNHFTFIVGSDSQAPDAGPPPAKWGEMATRLLNEDVDFHFLNGDVVDSGDSATDWDYWFSYGKSFIEQNLIYHACGNHECGWDINWGFRDDQFVLPGNGRYYSFVYGNALFIVLDSENAGVAAQLTWLRNQLQNSQQTWKFVFFHKPFYTRVDQREMDPYLSTWWKAFDDYGVDMIFNGHSHHYMRTKPLNRNISINSPVSEYGSQLNQGRMEIISGGYGGSPIGANNSDWFVEESTGGYNYVKVEVNGNTLYLTAHDINGGIIDDIALHKNSTALSTTTPTRTSTPTPTNKTAEHTASPGDNLDSKISQLACGDVLILRDGTYNSRMNVSLSCAASNPVTIRAEHDCPTVSYGQRCGNNSYHCPVIINGIGYSDLVVLTGSYINLVGIEIRNSGSGVGVLVQGNHNDVRNVFAHHNFGSGIRLQGTNNLVENSSVWYNGTEWDGGYNNPNHGPYWAGGLNACRNNSSYNTIRGNVICDNWGEGLSAFETHHIVMEDNVVFNNWSANVYISDATDVLFQRNLVYLTPDSPTQRAGRQDTPGIGLADEVSSSTRNITIINNLVIGNERNLYFWAGGVSGLNNYLIANNTFVNSRDFPNMQILGGPHPNSRIINNIFLQEDQQDIAQVSGSGLTFSNNLWSKTPPSNTMSTNSINLNNNATLISQLLSKTGTFAVGQLTGDWFKLQSNSPARNIGTNLFSSGITIDFAGKPRPQSGAFDIGAFQYGSSGSTTPSLTPSSCSLGDFNCDGKINESDLNALLSKWMTNEKDITGDNIVNESDLNKLLGNWRTQ